jgi:hypothetical protein
VRSAEKGYNVGVPRTWSRIVKKTFLDYLTICKNITLSPRRFFRGMPITEGIRKALYFTIFVYYFRSAYLYISSYHQGYFFNPVLKVNPVVSTYAAIFLGIAPFLWLLILYSESLFINRIGTFFGGVGNFEGAFKIMAYVLFFSLFLWIPVVNFIARAYALILLALGVREVFRLDWISSILTLFFAYIFTSILYLILFGFPAFMSRMVFFRF